MPMCVPVLTSRWCLYLTILVAKGLVAFQVNEVLYQKGMTPSQKIRLLLAIFVALVEVAELDILTRRDCGKKYHLAHGYVDFRGADTSLEAPVKCSTGYKTKTHGKIFCQADGTWSNETCVPKDCKSQYTIKDGTIEYLNTTYNSLATVKCKTGYAIQGRPYLICQANGTWNEDTACKPVDCGQNYTIKNGYVHFKGDKTTYNHQFPVSCLEGYSVIGDKNTTCLASGTWSKHSGCKPTDCGTEYELENGYANFTGANTTYKSKVPVFCRKGYFREGNDYLTCTENGTWSNDTKCHVVQCGTNHTILHSQANFTSRSVFHYGAIVPVYCDKGYKIEGDPYAICQANGTWSKTRCRIKDCGNKYHIDNGWVNFGGRRTTYNSKIPVTCNKGYRVHGDKYITCQANGKWSRMTYCIIHNCGTVYALENGYVDFFEQEVIYKKKVNVTCDTGYFATGRLEIECLKDGTWSKAECRNELLSDINIIIISGSAAGALLLIGITTTVILKLKRKLCFASD